MKGRKVLVTGATSYIGGRLIPRLLEAGHQVRCVARHASRLEGRSWLKSVEVFEADLTQAFARLGGERGWPVMNWSWQVRGFIDSLLGGVGMRRGRRDPEDLRVGDAVDFWRVEAVEEGRLVRFRAEMKLPGLAWLQFCVDPHGDGQSLLTQTAFFEPKGLPGLIYWYALYPFHARIFGGMIRNLSAEVETWQGLGDRKH